MDEIAAKIHAGHRISTADAVLLYEQAPMELLSDLATRAKSRFHPTDEVTYVIMAIINYTNICVAKCDYCAFYRLPHQSGTYLLNFDQICERIDGLLSLGGTLVGFNGGFHPKLRIEHYAEMFRKIREKYQGQLEFYGMTVAEFMFSCKLSKVSYEDGAALLKENGSLWVTGGGAEILDDAFRMRHSPGKYKVADYYKAQRAIVDSGMGSTATMVIGFDETLEERFNHLSTLRDFQDSLEQKLTSFLCWTYKPYHTELGGQEVSTEEYLRWLAISRLYLDNITHIRTSVLTKNEDALLGLRYGANDFDLPTEDEVTQKAGATITLNFESILQAARNLGFHPTLRKPFSIMQAEASVMPAVIQSDRRALHLMR